MFETQIWGFMDTLLITAIDREVSDQTNNKKEIRVHAKVKEYFHFGSVLLNSQCTAASQTFHDYVAWPVKLLFYLSIC